MKISSRLWTLVSLLLLRLSDPTHAIAVDLPYPEWSGPDLVQKLLDADSRSRAFHELWNRANPTNQTDYAAFEEDHYDPEVIVCPQPDGNPPIYVVLYGFLSRERFSPEPQYEIANPSELFFPGRPPAPSRSWDMPAIAVFTSAGLEIKPFGGDNCLDPPDRMADLNGDGFVERASHVNCGISGIRNATVLEITTVAPTPRPLLSVLFNWGADEWTWQLADADGDGIFNIELGPKTLSGIMPKVSYAWNPDTQTYDGPAGVEGDHFRRLDTTNHLFRILDQLKKSGLAFPVDPDFVDERRIPESPWERRGVEKPKPEDLSSPYHYASLQDLPDDELLRFMCDGKNASELEQATILTNQIPEDFWSLPPKDAALAFVEANRYPVHRELYALAIDDRDGRQPPTAGSVAMGHIFDKSYSDVDAHYFLHVDPDHSYLAYSEVENGTTRFSNMSSSGPTYDFRLCDLDYETARHLAHVLWWLDRVRSHRDNPPESLGSTFSTADGRTSLDFRSAAGSNVFHRDATLWSDHVAERWRGDYSPEVFLNLASHLFYAPLPARLGERWSSQAPERKRQTCRLEGDACPPPEPEVLPPRTPVFLNLFSLDQTALSLAIARDAVRAAGETADPALETPLSALLAQLPDLPPKRTRKQIEAEQDRLDMLEPDDSEREDRQALKHRLHEELMASYADTGANDFHSLKDALELSLRKIRSANDLDTLQAWARTGEPGADWALRRLNLQDTNRYADTLEWWIQNSTNYNACHAYHLLARANPARARETTAQATVKMHDDRSVATFTEFTRAKNMPDGPQRIAALIRVALSTNTDWQLRGQAIDLLAPLEQPLKYSDLEIDEALIRLMDPDMADKTESWPLGMACLALARRGRADTFDAMAKTLASLRDLTAYDFVLQALVQLAQTDPPRFNPRLVEILRPQFRYTNKSIQNLLMAAWAADLRELQPDIERIATSGPDDYESERAKRYGGEESALEGRFHLARQIATLWQEEDPATKAKLLIALGFQQALNLSVNPRPAETARLESELARLVHLFTPEQQVGVAEFIEQFRATQIHPNYPQNPRALFLDKVAHTLLSPAN